MKLHLRVISGVHLGDQAHLEPPGGLIGRADGCAMQLLDDSVSRSHVELRYLADGWWAYQQSLRSPTLLDGIPVDQRPLALRDRGILQIGGITVEYTHERPDAETADHESPPTMLNIRMQLPALQQAVLPQLTPFRMTDPDPSDAPATLILRPKAAENLPEPAPATLIHRPPSVSAPPPPLPLPIAAEATAHELARVKKERDQLQKERDELSAELQRLRQEQGALHEADKGRAAESPTSNQLAEQALRLLQPFGDSMEAASRALLEGDPTGARALLREASFGLADLRDLFESPNF